jgi:TatA/E family protein of Tat protein translocase
MGIGPMEIFVVLIIALVIFGPQKLPEMGRSLGKAIREFKSVGSEIQDEITKVTDEIDIDPEKTIKPPKDEIDIDPEKTIKPPKDEIDIDPEKTIKPPKSA